MEFLAETPRQRTRIFFILILAVAALWAMFLLQRGEMLQFTFMFASLAAINPVVAFVEMKDPQKSRSLFFFYLIILVALLWAAFLSYLGVHLWVSLLLFIIAVGVPFLINMMESEAEQPTS
jgi:predicted neutral ceramidase superfamily lipid hydrolase